MFTGFSDATIDFLWELRFHNERPWFLEHKQVFLDTLDRPMKALAADVTDPAEKARLEADQDSPIHGVVMPYPPERQGFVSSDVGDVSWVCPLAQINGTTMPADTAMHTWQMVSVGKSPMAKKGMLFAGRVMAACGIDCLEDPDILRRAKEEKDRRTGGRSYDPPIPPEVMPRIPKENA